MSFRYVVVKQGIECLDEPLDLILRPQELGIDHVPVHRLLRASLDVRDLLSVLLGE
jgi:hypothetical protein